MRMAIGIAQSIVNEESYSGYNYEVSTGYYKVLGLFNHSFKEDRSSIVMVMNYGNAIFAIAFLVPFFRICSRFWDRTIAVVSSIILMTIPIWWTIGLYGHPMLISAFFVFLALDFLTIPTAHFQRWRLLKHWLLIFLGGLALGFALWFRMDAVLMFPLVPAAMIIRGRRPIRSIFSSIGLGVMALWVMWTLKSTGSGEAGGQGLGSVLEVAANYHNLERLASRFTEGLVIPALGFHPLYAAVLLVSGYRMWRDKEFPTIGFVFPVVLINWLFWLPNPSPARHYVFAAPALAIGIGLLIGIYGRKIMKGTDRGPLIVTGVLVLIGIFVSEAMFPVVQRFYPWKHGVQDYSYRAPIRWVYLNKVRTQEAFLNGADFAETLLTMDQRGKPVLALTDYRLATTLRLVENRDECAASLRTVQKPYPNLYRLEVGGNLLLIPDTYEWPDVHTFLPPDTPKTLSVVVDGKSSFKDFASY